MPAKRTVRDRPTLFQRTTPLDAESAPPERDKSERLKRTFYLWPEDIEALDAMQAREFKRSRRKPELSDLISQAIQLLSQQDS